MTGGPIVGLALYEPSDNPAQLTLRLKVRAKVRNGDPDWKQRLLRELHHLMPGITETNVKFEIGEGYHLAVKYGKCDMTTPRWRALTKSKLNAMISGINLAFVIDVAPAGPNLPLCYVAACRGKVSKYDLELARQADEVHGIDVAPDQIYGGKALLVYAPGVMNHHELKRALRDALQFDSYA